MYFNPRSLAGATENAIVYIDGIKQFQSTLPRGSDKGAFEPFLWLDPISIHAPSRERPVLPSGLVFGNLFQSTLPRGSDYDIQNAILSGTNFNPRSLAGATVSHALPEVSRILFQSTLPRGSDFQVKHAAAAQPISIHAPSRERQLLIC